MARFFYDTEFLDDGKTIELISIGIVCEDGREYYAVNRSAPWTRIAKHQWLVENVVPTLPRIHGDRRLQVSARRNPLALDFDHPDMKPREVIAAEVEDFILPARMMGAPAPDIELWADYSAYDHVVLCQLYGPMMDLPAGFPMWTHDLEQLWENAGRPAKPEQGDGVHNALADARRNVKLFDACQSASDDAPKQDAEVGEFAAALSEKLLTKRDEVHSLSLSRGSRSGGLEEAAGIARSLAKSWRPAPADAVDGEEEPADDNTQDAAYWKRTAEEWHKAYLAMVDERDKARAQRNAVQQGGQR